MFFVGVVLYFLIACGVAWLLLFPSGRDFFFAFLSRWHTVIADGVTHFAQKGTSEAGAFRNRAGAAVRSMVVLAKRKALWLALSAVMLSVPPLLAVVAGRPSITAFEMSARPANPLIADLLKGEQLVPPPPLPPLVFTAQELEQERPMLSSADRRWELLNPEFAQRLLLVFKIMRETHGYEMVMLEGYRAPERQNMLALLDQRVTNAVAFQSYHQFGLAADSAFLRDGRVVISERDAWAMRGYELYGEVAESVGLHWGGRWRLRDFGHVELRDSNLKK